MLVKPYERVDDLQHGGLQIIQNPEWFSFGIDAVLLSAYARVKKGGNVVDLCTGTGIVPLLLSARTTSDRITGIELQADVADMARRSVALNHLEGRIEIVTADVMDLSGVLPKGSVDVVTCNPPYFKSQAGFYNATEIKKISRHEVALSLEGLFKSVSEILKPNGNFYMIHRPDRLVDIFYWARFFKVEPKRIRFVQPKVDALPNLVLVHFTKNGGKELKYDRPLVVYDDQGQYTDEIFEIYHQASLTAFEDNRQGTNVEGMGG